VVLSLAIACGGRTSALDSSDYDGSVDVVSGSGGKAGAVAGGKAGAAAGGKAGAGGAPGARAGAPTAAAGRPATTGGNGGSRGIGGSGAQAATGGAGGSSSTPIEVASACKAHCSSYGFICGADVGACTRTCEQELNGARLDCRALGLAALQCVAPDFQVKGVTCASGTKIALGRCDRALHIFETCKGALFSTPVPRESVTDVSSCAGMVSGDAVSGCEARFSCNDGAYVIYCSGQLPLADCSCYDPAGTTHAGQVINEGKQCYVAAQLLCHG